MRNPHPGQIAADAAAARQPAVDATEPATTPAEVDSDDASRAVLRDGTPAEVPPPEDQ